MAAQNVAHQALWGCQNSHAGKFPGGLAVKIPCFHFLGLGSVPGREIEISQNLQSSPKKVVMQRIEKNAELGKKAQAFHGRVNYKADDQVKQGAKAPINRQQGGGDRLLG